MGRLRVEVFFGENFWQCRYLISALSYFLQVRIITLHGRTNRKHLHVLQTWFHLSQKGLFLNQHFLLQNRIGIYGMNC